MKYIGKSISELHELLVKKEVTPLELTKEVISYCKKDTNNAFEYILEKEAIEFAKTLINPEEDNLLWGIPFVSKDNISTKDIIQITLEGEITEDTEIEPESYTSVFENRFFNFLIKDKTELKIDYSKYEKDVSLKSEFIRLVKEQKSLSDEEKSKVIMNGIKALAGRLN